MTMATLDRGTSSRGFLPTPLARIGLIIPSSNRLTEPQLRHFAPPELGIHVTRLQMTGKWNRPLSALGDDIQRAASALADAKCDIIVFHCTGHAMEEGPEGDARTRAMIKAATGIEAMSTASAIAEALGALQLKRLILLTPYDQDTNDHEIDYLRQSTSPSCMTSRWRCRAATIISRSRPSAGSSLRPSMRAMTPTAIS